MEKDLIEVQGLLKNDVPFREFVHNPTLKKEPKREAMEVVASKKKTADVTKNLLVLMAENGRLTRLDGVATAFRTLMAAHRGEVSTSAGGPSAPLPHHLFTVQAYPSICHANSKADMQA